MTDPKQKPCIFCQQKRKMSEEHVIPHWVSKVLIQDPRWKNEPFVIQRHGAEGYIHELPASELIEIVMKRVCKVCNESWMEEKLERPCQPFLGPMIRGRNTVLPPEAQADLAGWAAKVLMVMAYTHHPPQPVQRDWLDWMYEHQRPPNGWYVWTTSYVGQRPAFSASYDGQQYSVPGGRIVNPHAKAMTLVVGYAGLKVLGFSDVARVDEPGRDVLIRLWPSTGQAVSWPPPRYVDDAQLPAFVNAGLNPGKPPPKLP